MSTSATPVKLETMVRVPVDAHWLTGELRIPAGATGLVVFAHGSGSSRHSPRNVSVARVLEQHGCGTLLIDLLTEPEEIADRRTAHLRFDIGLLADRLVAIIDWLRSRPESLALPIGLFGASTGGGAALAAAALRPAAVVAVVSRGGRPDLAGDALLEPLPPTLLLVGDRDTAVIQMNRSAMAQMQGEVSLELVPGATHLFEEPGTLDVVADRAARWFARHFGQARVGA